MKFKAKPGRWDKTDAQISTLFVTEDLWSKDKTHYDRELAGLSTYLHNVNFEAKEGQIELFPTLGKIKSGMVAVVGMGKSADLNLDVIRKTSARLARRFKSKQPKIIALDLTSELFIKLDLRTVVHTVVEAMVLGSYKYDKYHTQSKKEPQSIAEVWLLVNTSRLQHATYGVTDGELTASATIFARDLVNESPTVTTPTYLAQVAKSLAKRGEVQVEILEEKAVRKMGMNSFLAVARGSNEAPKFIKLIYKGGKKKVVVAGKAVTFDTGGLNLKDWQNMSTMKLDMAGGAAVLGLFSVLPNLRPKATVIGLIAACENMPGASAMKQGDVVTAMNGKTIEILHTDAEGRLTLADVLSYAVKEKPDYIVDLATLTGACMVALGEEIAGLFVNHEGLRSKLKTAVDSAGELVWELPLVKEYKDALKSDFADLRNIGKTRYGGAITAALFLEEFVDKLPWAHLDIAGPAFAEKDTPLAAYGGTGFGVRTLIQFLKNL